MGLVVVLAGYLRLIAGVCSYMGFGDNVIVVDCFYIALFSTHEQTRCIYM